MAGTVMHVKVLGYRETSNRGQCALQWDARGEQPTKRRLFHEGAGRGNADGADGATLVKIEGMPFRQRAGSKGRTAHRRRKANEWQSVLPCPNGRDTMTCCAQQRCPLCKCHQTLPDPGGVAGAEFGRELGPGAANGTHAQDGQGTHLRALVGRNAVRITAWISFVCCGAELSRQLIRLSGFELALHSAWRWFFAESPS